MSTDCPFCDIAEGTGVATIIETGVDHVVFVPLGPHVPGHVLFVPRRHIDDATVDHALAAHVSAEAFRYVKRNGMQANVITSIGRDATQSVFHLHTHVIPRGSGDGLPDRWPWIGQVSSS